MRKTRFMQFLTPALVALLAAGCGGGEGGGDDAGEEMAGQESAAMEFPVAEANQGSIAGSVMFDGEAPAAEPIDMAAEPTCSEMYDTPPMTQQVVVNENGALANVFIHVTQGPHSELQFPTPADSVTLDQEGCRYHPHVLGVQAGQTLAIMNSDGILHNINAQPTNNRGFNISQPVEMTSGRTFNAAEVMIPLKCDVHGWMNAYLGVMSHPYFAVSDDAGSFAIDRLPPGDYVVEAWHERYGTMTANVTVAAGETAEAAFTFSESMAENAEVPLGEPLDLHDHGDPAAADQDR